MPKTSYDTRFFAEYFYSTDPSFLKKAKETIRKAEGYISTIVIHEVYQLVLKKEGRDTAMLRTAILEKDFKTIKVTSEIAKNSAELRQKYRLPLADSIIASTAVMIKAICISDDPHLKGIEGLTTKWP